MRQWLVIMGIGLTGLGLGVGCANDPSPTLEHTHLVASEYRTDGSKPLPPPNPEDTMPAPPYYDAPLVSQHMPEEQAFVNAYGSVGRPKILVFVNRTLEGELMPVNPDIPVVNVDRRVQTGGAGSFHESANVYLRPGQYDEIQAKSLDYEAVENILTDWLSADGRVQIVSPTLARQRLTDQQVKDLQSGRPTVGRELAQQLDAHVLVQVQAHPTQQTQAGLQVRIIAEAIDLKHDGASLARAVVDVPPPLDKVQINKYTRYLSRKLMDGMIGSWQTFAPRAGAIQPQLPPAQSPDLTPPVWPRESPSPAPVTVPTPSPVQTVPSSNGDGNLPPVQNNVPVPQPPTTQSAGTTESTALQLAPLEESK